MSERSNLEGVERFMYVWDMSSVLKDMGRKETNEEEKNDRRRGKNI